MLIVECDPDLALVETLTIPSRRRNKHAAGKSMVIRNLMRTYRDSVGMIDEDPGSIQPNDLQRFTETNSLQNEQIRIRHYNQRNNRLIILCPKLEEWILGACTEAGIDIRGYNLPNNPNQLHEIINVRISRFRQLVEDLMERSSRVRALQTCLRESPS